MEELEQYAGLDCLDLDIVRNLPLFKFKRRLNEIRKEQSEKPLWNNAMQRLLSANPTQNSHKL